MLPETDLSHLVEEKRGLKRKSGPKACNSCVVVQGLDFNPRSFPRGCAVLFALCQLQSESSVQLQWLLLQRGVGGGGGQSSLFLIQLSDYNDVLQPCLYEACLFFKPKKRRKNHHTNNECQV